ncbi:unnamed protein product [Sphagnum balticum]
MLGTSSVVAISDSIEDLKDNGLMVEGPPRGLEKIYDYEAGGHHPVRLSDILHERYKVIHKLGSGGYANVWLCRDVTTDSPRYLAVKIIMAEGSNKDCPELRVNRLIELGLDIDSVAEHFCLPLDQFEIDGPNGLHYVLVYPVLGPRVSRLLNVGSLEDPGKILRSICLQTTQAMATLHAHGICHGASGDAHHEPTAPQYLVYPISWDSVELSALGTNFITNKACIIDFGESYEFSDPSPDLGIPQIYCSPEYTLDKKVGIGSDVWALGCTLFEIRTGKRLFDTFDDDIDEYLCKLAMILGKFPEPWWSTTWERRKDFFEDNAGADGRVVEIRREVKSGNAETHHPGREKEPEIVIIQQQEPRSLQDALAPGMFHKNRHGPGVTQRNIAQQEIDHFSELLAGIFKYAPEERLTVRDVLAHAWFNL